MEWAEGKEEGARSRRYDVTRVILDVRVVRWWGDGGEATVALSGRSGECTCFVGERVQGRGGRGTVNGRRGGWRSLVLLGHGSESFSLPSPRPSVRPVSRPDTSNHPLCSVFLSLSLSLSLPFSDLSRSPYVFSTLVPLFPSVSPCSVAAFRYRSSLQPLAKRDASRVSNIIYIMRTARGCACTLQLHTTPFCRVQCQLRKREKERESIHPRVRTRLGRVCDLVLASQPRSGPLHCLASFPLAARSLVSRGFFQTTLRRPFLTAWSDQPVACLADDLGKLLDFMLDENRHESVRYTTFVTSFLTRQTNVRGFLHSWKNCGDAPSRFSRIHLYILKIRESNNPINSRNETITHRCPDTRTSSFQTSSHLGLTTVPLNRSASPLWRRSIDQNEHKATFPLSLLYRATKLQLCRGRVVNLERNRDERTAPLSPEYARLINART